MKIGDGRWEIGDRGWDLGIEVKALDWILKEIHGLIGLEYQSISMIGPRGLCGLRDAYFSMVNARIYFEKDKKKQEIIWSLIRQNSKDTRAFSILFRYTTIFFSS